jgi:Protein of unknown function (DUF1360)
VTLLILTIWTLAAMRLTRLINGDTILDPLRAKIMARARDAADEADRAATTGRPADRLERRRRRADMIAYFIECPWCVGLWLCLLTAYLPVRLIGWPWWALLPVALAGSHLIGVCARFADTDPIEYEDER